jgi:L-asparaginase
VSDVTSVGSEWSELLEYRRAGIAEVAIHGAVSWVTGATPIHGVSASNLIFGRSLTKPYQMKGLAKDLDSVLSPEAKALSVASHGSEEIHLRTLKTILPPDRLPLITTPPSMPLGVGVTAKTPSAFFHPCSGKHAAILKACEIKGWPLQGYTSPDHPYHKIYVSELKRVLGETWEPRVMAKDGCGLPTFSTTVTELASLYADLVSTKDSDWIWNAMTSHPEIVGGTGRLDTAIMKAMGGRVLAKEGADGLLGLSIKHRSYPNGLGVVVKIAHGWDPKAMWFIASAILRTLDFPFPNPSPLDRQTAYVSNSVVPQDLSAKFDAVIAGDVIGAIDDKWS